MATDPSGCRDPSAWCSDGRCGLVWCSPSQRELGVGVVPAHVFCDLKENSSHSKKIINFPIYIVVHCATKNKYLPSFLPNGAARGWKGWYFTPYMIPYWPFSIQELLSTANCEQHSTKIKIWVGVERPCKDWAHFMIEWAQFMLDEPISFLKGLIPGLRGSIPGFTGPISGLRRPMPGLTGPSKAWERGPS